ncbi:MAG: hypothetical protein Q9190_008092 [Brigantiaea leucoxantha]
MSEFREIFHFDDEFGVVICKNCACAVPLDDISGHLKSKHKLISPEDRADIVRQRRELDGLVANEPRYPDPDHPPLPYLPVCRFVSGAANERHIAEHFKKLHGWVNDAKVGVHRGGRTLDRPWIHPVSYQRFSKLLGWNRLFVVAHGREEPQPTSLSDMVDLSCSRQEVVKEQLRKEQATIDAERDAAQFEANPWLQTVGWARITWIATLNKPLEGEASLERACESMWRVVNRGVMDSLQEVVGHTVLAAFNKVSGEGQLSRPVHSRLTAATIKSYAEVWKEVLMRIWRIYKYQSVYPQFASLITWQQIESLVNHDLKGRDHDSLLVKAIAVTGRLAEGWASAAYMSPRLSAINTVARLAMVSYATAQVNADVEEIQSRLKCNRVSALAQTKSLLERIDEMITRFMGLHVHGCISGPMNYLLRIRSYATVVHFNQTGQGRIDWEGDTIISGSVSFAMNDLRLLCIAWSKKRGSTSVSTWLLLGGMKPELSRGGSDTLPWSVDGYYKPDRVQHLDRQKDKG